MTDSISVLVPGFRVTDANGNPVSGAKLKFYEAGTTTPKTVYSNEPLSVSLGSVVTCDAGGYPTSDGSTKVIIYTGTGLYKVVITDASDVTIATHDNVRGATVTPVDDGVGLPETPVVSKTGNYTVVLADRGKLINANCTGGSFAITLASAIAGQSGDGFRIGVRHVGSANRVTIKTVSGQTISFSGASATAKTLVGYGETMWLVSDGAGWNVDSYTPARMTSGLPFFDVVDRLTTPPGSPVAGARYIITGTPVGLWSGYAANDVVEADGNGGWVRYTPQEGWFARVLDEDLYTSFTGTVWSDQVGMGSAASSHLKHAVFEHQLASGTSGGTSVAGAMTQRTLNTTVVNTITGASLSANDITLPAGKYLITASQQVHMEVGVLGNASSAQQRIIAGTASIDALPLGVPSRGGGIASGAGIVFTAYHTHALRDVWLLNVTVAGTIKLQYWTSLATATTGLGFPTSNGTEVYARVQILDLLSLQGERGVDGLDGPNVGLNYMWSTATSGDPGTGKILVNNASPASATVLHISETNRTSASQAAYIATWDNGTTAGETGVVRIMDYGAPGGNFLEYRITGTLTDAGAYDTFPVTYIGGAGTILADTVVAVMFTPTGNAGATGPNAGLDYQWNTGTSGDPGSGKILGNNATPASITALHISETNRQGASQTAFIAAMDDSTNTLHRGVVRIVDAAAPGTNFLEFRVNGNLTDLGAYDTLPVAHIGGAGTIANNAVVSIGFTRTSDGSGSLVLLTSGTVSAAATLDIVLTSYTGYRGIVFELTNFTPATDDVELWMRVSTDGGATYDAGAGNYRWGLSGNQDSGVTLDQGSASDTKLGIAYGTPTASVSNVAAEGGTTSRVVIMNQTDTGKWPRASWDSGWLGASGTLYHGRGWGTRVTAQDTDAVRFLFESGNITSGAYAVYGLS